MSQRRDASETTVPGAVLAILRAVSGRSQKELAAAAGLDSRTISAYEKGRTTLTIARLQELVGALDLPPAELEAAVRYLSERRAAIARHRGGGPEAALRAEIDVIAAGMARTWEDFTRGSVEEVLAQAGILVDRREAPGLWARLQPFAAGERLELVQEGADFQSWALCELVCEESEKAAADDAAAAVALGDLAVEIARRVAGEEGWRKRLKGYAQAFLANAIRVGGRLAAAGDAFEGALAVWESGAPADPAPLDGSRLLDLEASLRRGQRRLDESLELLERALKVHPTGPTAARLLVKRGKTLEELGDYEGAVANLRQAAPQIDPERDPRLQLAVILNLAWDLCELGRAGQGAALLPEARALAARLGNHLDLVRLRWVEGRLAAGLSHTEEAVSAFREVRDRFLTLKMPYDAALATMQLAVVLLGQDGRAAEVKALASEAAPIFEDEGVHSEARKALALFRRAAEEERATLDLARRLAAYLERARWQPALSFAAPA
jgi:transcriptional regulator with XRE-family HTH domain